jgi:hypothetical protein
LGGRITDTEGSLAFSAVGDARAGCRLLIFLPLTYVLTEATSALLNHVPLTARILSAHVRGIMTPAFGIIVEIPVLLAFPLGALIM